MKTMLKILVIITMPLFVLTADLPFLMVDLVPDAQAIFGVRRRAVRRGVIIGEAAATSTNSAATTAQQQSATAQQQSATAQQQSATAQQQVATAQQQTAAPPPATPGTALPMGTIVHTLPAGCPAKAIGGVEYYFCGGNYYRTAFQGSNLVYVTANP
jgi:hypothetical protein